MSAAPQRKAARDKYVACRTIGHAWDEFIPHGMRAPAIGARISLRCLRCPCERHDLVNRITGKLIPGGRSYVYPDDYKLAEKLSRAQWRRRYVQAQSTPKGTRQHLALVKR